MEKKLLSIAFLALLTIGVNAQNVGIGTTSPQRKLHVFSAGDVYLGFSNNTTGSAISDGVILGLDNNSRNFRFMNQENANLLFGTNGLERFRIDSLGNVGIGTATPSSKLEVNGTIKATGLRLPTGAVNGYVLKSDANGNASWVDAELMDSVGSTAIGQSVNPTDTVIFTHPTEGWKVTYVPTGSVMFKVINPANIANGNCSVYVQTKSGNSGMQDALGVVADGQTFSIDLNSNGANTKFVKIDAFDMDTYRGMVIEFIESNGFVNGMSKWW